MHIKIQVHHSNIYFIVTCEKQKARAIKKKEELDIIREENGNYLHSYTYQKSQEHLSTIECHNFSTIINPLKK